MCILLVVSCISCKDENQPSDSDKLGGHLNEAVNTDGVPHATHAVIDADGSVHLVADSQPATQPKRK